MLYDIILKLFLYDVVQGHHNKTALTNTIYTKSTYINVTGQGCVIEYDKKRMGNERERG